MDIVIVCGPPPEPIESLLRLWWLGSLVLLGVAHWLTARPRQIWSPEWHYVFVAGLGFHALCLLVAGVGLAAGVLDVFRGGLSTLIEMLVLSVIAIFPVIVASVVGLQRWRTLLSRVQSSGP
jgi:hypothetical protein